jgi:molybdate transport system substrate-binding protein
MWERSSMPEARHRRMPFHAFLALSIVAAVAAGRFAPQAASAAPAPTLVVFAAASLTEAFTDLGRVGERRTPGLRVAFNFAGSQQLAAQIALGARADVFASADQRWMDYLQERQLLEGVPREFARNLLVVIVPRTNPGHVTQLQDLSRMGVKLVIEAEAVPAGKYSREALAKLAQAPGFPPFYEAQVLGNVVSEEDNVKGVVTKVELAEADAGIVYRSDITPSVAGKVTVIEIPVEYNVVASYPIALVKGTSNADAGRQFIDLLLSRFGQRVLRSHNFTPLDQP